MKGGKSKADTKKSDAMLKKKGGGAGKRAKKAKDPNKPKRPPSAFFVFMEGFRKEYKEEHPDNKSVSAVGKAGGEKWKSMSDAEKTPYIAKAEKRKSDYNKSMQAYNKKLAEDESDKSKSTVNDEDEEEGSGEEEEDED